MQENTKLNTKLENVDFGGVHREQRNPVFARYPAALQIPLKRSYLATAGPVRRVLFGDERWSAVDQGRGTDSYFQADIELAAKDRKLRAAFVHVAFNESELHNRASIHARACERFQARHPPERALRLACDYAMRQEIQPPGPQRGRTLLGCLNRLATKRWWLRAMRRTYTRKAEEDLRALEFVHMRAGLYVSDQAFRSRISRKLAIVRLLDQALATNDLGESLTLSDLSACNTSNPAIRRAELMVRARGCENYAKEHGQVPLFLVITVPSRFHRVYKTGGLIAAFDGSTPRDGQKWLNRRWQRLRSWLGRKGILYYGLRTAEPHHDGTPHWNVLLYAAPSDIETIAAAFDRYFLLSDFPDDPGAGEHRLRRIDIDPARGATAYIAKYVAKNIDGSNVGVDHEDTEHQRNAADTSPRVEGWASIHGIRQFQFFGGPAVTIWRELRRLNRPSLGIIEQAREAAELPDWCGFIRVMGGAQRKASTRPVRVHRLLGEGAGFYGDPLGSRVVGIESDELVEVTRIREWSINWHPGVETLQ